MQSADYKILIFDTNAHLLRTISGHTEKGIIDVIWDLTTEDGGVRHDREFDAKVYVRPFLSGVGKSIDTNTNAFLGPYPYGLCRSGPE